MAGVGPLLAWRRRARRPAVRRPGGIRAAVVVAVLALTDAGSSPTSVLLFAFARSPSRPWASSTCAPCGPRRLVASEPLPVALTAVVRRNRRRYGGYLVHVGVAVALLGVAASSAFNSATCGSAPETHQGGRLRHPLRAAHVRPLERAHRPAPCSTSARTASGYDAAAVPQLLPHPERRDGPLPRLGESTSEVGLETGWTRDVWTAMQPDL